MAQREAWITRRGLFGVSWKGLIGLLAVGSTLLVVSLPQLRGFALQENEEDARRTALRLARELSTWESPGDPRAGDLFQGPELTRVLRNADVMREGRFLRRHGYLFEVVRVPAPPAIEAGFFRTVLAEGPGAALPRARLSVRAWPWRHGQTGTVALLAFDDGRLFLHPNRAAEWSGPQPPAASAELESGWIRTR